MKRHAGATMRRLLRKLSKGAFGRAVGLAAVGLAAVSFTGVAAAVETPAVVTSQGGDAARTPTHHDAIARGVAYWRREIVDAYDAVCDPEPDWEKPARALIEHAAEWYALSGTREWYRPKRVPDTWTSLALGRAAIDAGCDDPLVLLLTAESIVPTGRIGQAGAMYAQAFNGFDEMEKVAARVPGTPTYSPYWTLRAADGVLEHAKAERWAGVVRRAGPAREKAIVRLLTRPSLSSDEREAILLVDTLSGGIRSRSKPRQESNVELISMLRETAGIDPWVLDMMEGRLEVELAWAARGIGMVNTVPQEGRERFQEHSDEAYRLFLAAHKRYPDRPYSATDLIYVTMGRDASDTTEPRYWFDQARQVQFDFRPAFELFAWAMRPRWQGSTAELVRLGREFGRSDRFDTCVPYHLIVFLSAAVGEVVDLSRGSVESPEQWRELLSRRGIVYTEARRVLDGYLAYWAQHPPGDPSLIANYRSQKAALAFVAGRYQDAREDLAALVEAGTPAGVPDGFGRFGTTYARVAGETALFTGPQAEAYRAARKLADADAVGEAEPAAIRAAIEALDGVFRALPDTPEQDAARAWLTTESIRLAHDAAFYAEGASDPEGDGWQDLPIGEKLAGWRVTHGEWSVDDEGRLVGVGTADGLNLLYVGDVAYPDIGYEFAGTIEFVELPKGRIELAAGFPITYGGSHWGVVYLLPQTGERILAWVNKLLPPQPADVRTGPNAFLIRVHDRKMTFTLNGTDPARPWPIVSTDTERRTYPFVIGLGGVYDARSEGIIVRYADLRLRPLPTVGE